ncbi:methylmalonyl-CoA epimerase [Bacillus sp. 2205SS5-2]|uniref:methylmalonyl-CoA epimerase n=1 Tax=Bacillus sp. 2205SS5-2 TaxID=3109031 RepID=UPI003004676A
MKRVDHLGIAVPSIDEALPLYTEVFGLPLLKIEEVPSENVRVAFIDGGTIKLELLEPLSPDSAIAGFLEKKGQGIHHIAFEVENIEQRIFEMKEKGIEMIHHDPKLGAGGAQVAFMHPKSTQKVLTELCEKPAVKGE